MFPTINTMIILLLGYSFFALTSAENTKSPEHHGPSPSDNSSNHHSSNHHMEFDKDFVGVVFATQVKNWDGDIPPANTYTKEEVKIMLTTVSVKFTNISTFGTGLGGQDCVATEGIGHTARAAAELNASKNKKLLTVTLGIWQHEDQKKIDQEMVCAIKEVEKTNLIYNGTISGLIYTSNYVHDQATAEKVLHSIQKYKTELESSNVKIGIRLINCEQILEGDLHEIMKSLAAELDFVHCFHLPSKSVSHDIQKAAKQFTETFPLWRHGFKEINKDIEVIGETGWPSQGISDGNTSSNTLDNMKAFWFGIAGWASKSRSRIHFFEAFDQPWKNAKNNPNGSDGHYGWWKLIENKKLQQSAYVEKIYERKEQNPANPVKPVPATGASKTSKKPSSTGSTNTPMNYVAVFLAVTSCFAAFNRL